MEVETLAFNDWQDTSVPFASNLPGLSQVIENRLTVRRNGALFIHRHWAEQEPEKALELASATRAGYAQFMRGVIAIAGVVAVTLAACNRFQPVTLDTIPPTVSPASPSPDDPPSTGSVAQSPAPVPEASQVECSREVAAQIVRVEHTAQASNDPCVVYWRSMEVRQHPERSSYLECSGLKAYPDPQPKGHPVSLAECDRQLRERQARMAVPVTGMSDEQKATYRATWGK